MRYFSKREEGDPSEIQQIFTSINLQVWCCRYWKLNQWDCNEMSFPYWRIYWNKNEGAVVSYGDNVFEPDSNKLLMIPPNTSFQAHLKQNHMFETGMKVIGKRITEKDQENLIQANHLLHLFIHFTLGAPYDNVQPDIYEIKLNNDQKQKLTKLTEYLKAEVSNFSLQANLQIQTIITEMLGKLPPKHWDTLHVEHRILNCIRYIERNIHLDFNNNFLAKLIGLATNSFIRLFTSEMGISPQNFIKKQKIAKACALLDHTEMKIDEIAHYLGFADRYHFTRVFKKITDSPPGIYRKGN